MYVDMYVDMYVGVYLGRIYAGVCRYIGINIHTKFLVFSNKLHDLVSVG